MLWRVCCDLSSSECIKQVPEKQCGGFVDHDAVSAPSKPRETVWRVCCDLSECIKQVPEKQCGGFVVTLSASNKSSECIKQVPEKQCGGFVVTLALVSASNKSQRNSVEGLL